jgi:hypothetical protein
MDNLALWNSVCRTDPSFTKQFSRSGGFKGTAISPMYLMMRATEKFGPVGVGWGFSEIENKIAEGVWFSKVLLWYKHEGERGEVEQWGATTMVQQRQSGQFVDEEAAKKSVTDAVTKCLSYIGFAADVHLGLYDDTKYVNELRTEKREEAKQVDRAKKEAPAAAPAPAPATAKGPTKVYDHGKAIATISGMKETVGEVSYRRILGAHGYEKANEIPGKAEMMKVYHDLAAEANRLKESGNAA